ncbi:MAG TPA: hypothetical protein VN541_12180 [Tepidisphaeraceae bacterium]|nr:hypothetical protein [Tepidisphaeraceae bacterium]
MKQWWHDHGLSLMVVFLALSLAGLAILVLVLVRLPADYFVTSPHLPARHSVGYAARLIIRNAMGLALVIIGIVLSMPLVPGPGVLAILLGVSLMSFPGKRKLEIRILRTRGVFSTINGIRARFGQAPLVLPPRDVSSSEGDLRAR